MNYRIKLPDENNQVRIEELENNALIIIGANGTGKSRLGAWIEQQDFEIIHRVSAQRSLIFNDFIDLKSYTQSENILFLVRKKEIVIKIRGIVGIGENIQPLWLMISMQFYQQLSQNEIYKTKSI